MVQNGPSTGPPGLARPPTDIEYARWAEIYIGLPHPRSPARASRIAKIGKPRMIHAINVGWPGFPPLRERAEGIPTPPRARRWTEAESTKPPEAVSAEVVKRTTGVIMERWDAVVGRHMQAVADMSETIKQVGSQLRVASREATFVQYRRVPEMDAEGRQVVDGAGKPLMRVERYIPMETVARATARLAMAAKDHAVLHKALLDSLSPMKDAAIDMSDAPQEVLDYVQKKWGSG